MFTGLLASSLYILCFYEVGLMIFELSLALQGLWIGSLDRIEGILVNESNYATGERDLEYMKMAKCVGLIFGPILGYFGHLLTDISFLSYQVYSLSIPGFIQFVCCFIMILFYCIVRFEIFTPSSLLPPSEQHHFNRTESLALGNASLQLSKVIDKAHLQIFTAFLIFIAFSFSKAIREVALPVLTINQSNTFDKCKCSTSFELDGVYLGFAGVALFEALGMFVTYRMKNSIENKYQIFLPLILGFTGQVLMISYSQISLEMLATGFALQGFSVSMGMVIAGNMLHEIIGNDPPAHFTAVGMSLELLGSLLGPFWTLQAYMVKCSLCFSLISFFVAVAILLMLVSICIPVESSESEIIKSSTAPKRAQTGRKPQLMHRTTTDIKKYPIRESEMVNLKKVF